MDRRVLAARGDKARRSRGRSNPGWDVTSFALAVTGVSTRVRPVRMTAVRESGSGG